MNISSLYQIYKQNPTVITDSRDCQSGSIFFALKGDKFNGNEFARQALENGCSFAIVDEEKYATNDKIILVENSLKTLQQLANYHRKQLHVKVIGITGTNGKTTTKELIAAVLSTQYNILYTEGNLNNHIGVPLTLLRLNSQHDLAVIEMGASHPGDIRELVEIAEPDYGIITNVGKAHLEGFGSYKGVISTKGELYEYLRRKNNSVVFIQAENADLLEIAQELTLISYGSKDTLYVNGQITANDPFLSFQWKSGKNGEFHQVQTKLIGEYNLDNLLAAVAVGKFFAIKPDKVDKALEEYFPQNSRSQLMETASNHIIIDAYNANPTSMKAALLNFKNMNVTNKMVILGDMKELGKASDEEHQTVIDLLDEYNFDKVILIGNEFSSTNHTYLSFKNMEEALQSFKSNPPKEYYILLKGSNSLRLNQLINKL